MKSNPTFEQISQGENLLPSVATKFRRTCSLILFSIIVLTTFVEAQSYVSWTQFRNVDPVPPHGIICTQDFGGEEVTDNVALGSNPLYPDSGLSLSFHFEHGS